MTSLLFQTSSKADGNMSFMYGNVNEVRENRKRFLNRFGNNIEDCVVMEAEHKDGITHVGTTDKNTVIKTEAFITNEKGVILFLLTGDCFPVCFYDPVQQVVALAHLGWKPTDKYLAKKVVQEFVRKYDSNVLDIQVYLGPGIHKESYVFTNPVQKHSKGWSEFITELPNGDCHIDLIGHITRQLYDESIPPDNISISPVDTCSSSEYWSYYRANKTGEPDGRFVSIVALV